MYYGILCSSPSDFVDVSALRISTLLPLFANGDFPFHLQSIPKQLNTNVIKGLVKRWQLLWTDANFYETMISSMKTSMLIEPWKRSWSKHSIIQTHTIFYNIYIFYNILYIFYNIYRIIYIHIILHCLHQSFAISEHRLRPSWAFHGGARRTCSCALASDVTLDEIEIDFTWFYIWFYIKDFND